MTECEFMKKESASLEAGQLRGPHLWNRNRKTNKTPRASGTCQLLSSVPAHTGRPGQRGNGAERVFEEIMFKSYPKLIKNTNLSPRSSINYKQYKLKAARTQRRRDSSSEAGC